MGFNFVGEVDAVHEQQLEFISEILKERGFKKCDVAIEPVGKAGDNFIANVKRIVVSQDGKVFKMIAKLAPLMRDMLDVTAMFQNELVIYTILFPEFKELQKKAGVPDKEWFRHPECYGTFMEQPNEVILLEDLKDSNFDILNKFKPMSIECAKLVLKNFAVYHSLSYALKDQNPEKFDEISSLLVNIYDVPPEVMEMRIKFEIKMENEILEKLSDERHKEAFIGTMSNFKELAEMPKKEKGSKSSVIQQGDGWTNNIMFAFEDDKPSKCVLIDYQMSRESSPVYDIMYMIFNSISTEEIIEHYTELIDYYYDELDKSLNNYGLKAPDVHPRKQLDVDMKRYAKLILGISIIIANLIIKDVAEASKIRETMESATNPLEDMMELLMERSADTEVLFQKRIEGLARSVTELGLL